jgi:hypothetical protein
LRSKLDGHVTLDLRTYIAGILVVLDALRRFSAGLLGLISAMSSAAAEFVADDAHVLAQQCGDPAEGLICFQQAANLM